MSENVDIILLTESNRKIIENDRNISIMTENNRKMSENDRNIIIMKKTTENAGNDRKCQKYFVYE